MRASRAAAVALGACAACVAVVVQAQTAITTPPRIELTWHAPSACPDEAAVRANVAQLLAGSSAPALGSAEVRRSGERWEVVVRMNGGERRLEADSCRALADATALIVAMAVDPARVVANRTALDAGVAPSAPPLLTDAAAPPGSVDAATPLAPPLADAATPLADAAAPPVPPAAPAPAAAPPTPEPSPSSSSSGSSSSPPPSLFALSASASADFGTVPSPTLGPSLAFAWTPWPFRLELGATYFPSSSTSTTLSGAAASFTLLAGELRGCYAFRAGTFELSPCAGVEAARLEGAGRGITFPASGASGLFALGPALVAGWRFLPYWALFARGDALFQLVRPDFQVDASTLYRPGVVTGRASAGVEVRF